MKIKRFDITGILMYPIIINPLIVIAYLLLLLNFVFLCWWHFERTADFKYWELKFYVKRKSKVELVIPPLLILINTIWLRDNKTRAYCRYLEFKWFPYCFKQDKRYQNEINGAYGYYTRVKNRFWEKK